mmetsp:Transcript_7218/g.15414  ORF Transcript_7218/g.15414 Transcript_7218/m.15414 type:complete len:93 (+) Transcript_7218:2876-3154(+)
MNKAKNNTMHGRTRKVFFFWRILTLNSIYATFVLPKYKKNKIVTHKYGTVPYAIQHCMIDSFILFPMAFFYSTRMQSIGKSIRMYTIFSTQS